MTTAEPPRFDRYGALASKGKHTAAAVQSLQRLLEESLVDSKVKQELLPTLVDALGTWDDEASAEVIGALEAHLKANSELDLLAIERWTGKHLNDPAAVIDCLSVDPPKEFTIIELLSRAGSQKLVFLANWRVAQREVVLKRFIGEGAAERLIRRELQPHPLSMAHPNIIETHLLTNVRGEPFLVERRLGVVLTDDWQAPGVHEAANLLFDIASALEFLHNKGLVHGDIKPDNIGFEDDNYILLDFGISRPIEDFAGDTTPTGSLRTRAPELLLEEKLHSNASDVWALGATVFNVMLKRFPLFDHGETPPRISDPTEREAYEVILRDRVSKEWDERINRGVSNIEHDALRDLVRRCLARDPIDRITAQQLRDACERQLTAFIRVSAGPTRFSPSEEISQLERDLPDKELLELMPHGEKIRLQERLTELGGASGLKAEEKRAITTLQEKLS